LCLAALCPAQHVACHERRQFNTDAQDGQQPGEMLPPQRLHHHLVEQRAVARQCCERQADEATAGAHSCFPATHDLNATGAFSSSGAELQTPTRIYSTDPRSRADPRSRVTRQHRPGVQGARGRSLGARLQAPVRPELLLIVLGGGGGARKTRRRKSCGMISWSGPVKTREWRGTSPFPCKSGLLRRRNPGLSGLKGSLAAYEAS
jgi:hypothetical protein